MFSCQNTSKRGGGVHRGIQILNLKYPNPSVLKQICSHPNPQLVMQAFSRQNVILPLTRPEKVTGLYLWHKTSGTYQDFIKDGVSKSQKSTNFNNNSHDQTNYSQNTHLAVTFIRHPSLYFLGTICS